MWKSTRESGASAAIFDFHIGPLADAWHATNPHVSQRAVRAFHRGRMHLSRLELDAAFEAAFDGVTGGYPWDCSSDRALDGYFTRADVQAALHLKGPGSGFKCGAAHESDLTPSPRRHTRFAQVQAERPRVATPLAAFGPTHAGIDL